MKPMKRTLTLLTAILLAAALMTGCTILTEAKDNTPSATDTPAETGDGVYVKLERDDVASLYIHGGSFSKVCENADGSPLKAGEWIYTGEDIVEISKKDNCSVVFTVGATAADDTLLAEGTFLYDAVQETRYVTISADGVTCSTSNAADAFRPLGAVHASLHHHQLRAAQRQRPADAYQTVVRSGSGNAVIIQINPFAGHGTAQTLHPMQGKWPRHIGIVQTTGSDRAA